MYLHIKFQVSSIILTRFRQEGNSSTPTAKQTSQKPTMWINVGKQQGLIPVPIILQQPSVIVTDAKLLFFLFIEKLSNFFLISRVKIVVQFK